MRKSIRQAIAALALLATPWAMAGYLQWETVELPAASGAACGDGSPYRFFVNRTPVSRNTVLVFEGGGACWDQNACSGIGPLSAANPNGIPADYLNQLNTAAHGLVTPFSARFDPFQAVQTQSWNIVYIPYCTGDVHGGSKVTVYADADPAHPRTQYHRGQANIRAAAQWLRANLGQPQDLLLTGFSAGGAGATITYGLVRDTLQPTGRSSLIADSGPLMQAPRGGDPAVYPSLPLHETIRVAWGLDQADGTITLLAATLPAFDSNNLGSVNGALASAYPNDRLTFLAFQSDTNFSAFSYQKFYPEIANAPNDTVRQQLLLAKWQPDLAQWAADLAQHANIAYHLPFYRDFNDSHCLTIVDFSGTGIEELGIVDISPVVASTLDRGPIRRDIETPNTSDYSVVLSNAIKLFKLLLKIFT